MTLSADGSLPLRRHEQHWTPQTPSAVLVGGEVLGTGRLPDELVGDLLDWFRFTREDERLFSLELRASRGLHAVLGNLDNGWT